jgi:hypothetical protein
MRDSDELGDPEPDRPGPERGMQRDHVLLKALAMCVPAARPWAEARTDDQFGALAALERHPLLLLRGLIHSDGCRANNWARVRGKRYEYARYMFSNKSKDIQRVFTEACDRAGIEWRQSYDWTISVSRRSSVEVFDRFIGPKS